MMNSPFSDRGMITDPNRFFGRTAETQKIFNALAGNKPQCVSIIGDRRIGRSSLLQHILRSYPQHLSQPSRYRFAYLDLSRDTCRHPTQFYAEVAQAFGTNSANRLSPQQFDDWLSNQSPQQSSQHIILLDEFNVLQRRRKRFDDDFYDGLRSRANAGEITFVLATHVPLHKIALANNFTSSFFGIFTPVDLMGFSYSEVEASILRTVATPLRKADFDEIREWVRDDNKYHPLKLNIAADLVWQALPMPDYVKLKKQYKKDVAHVFGQRVHDARQKQRRRATVARFWQWFIESLHWITGGKPYWVLILFIIGLLFWLGVINLGQIQAALLNLAGIPTVTPTPIP